MKSGFVFTSNPPSPKRQSLQFQHGRSDEKHKSDSSNHHAQDIRRVVAVVQDGAGASAVDAAVLLRLEGAREGRRDQGVFQSGRVWGRRRWVARGCREKVD